MEKLRILFCSVVILGLPRYPERMGRFYFFVIIAFFTCIAHKAQAEEAIDTAMVEAAAVDIRGYWAAPDCATYHEALVLTGKFYLHTSSDTIVLQPADMAIGKEDYDVLKLPKTSFPVTATEDGILMIGHMEDDNADSWSSNWDDLDIINSEEFASCHEFPTLVPESLAQLMRHIDQIAAHCAQKNTAQCSQPLFAFADQDSSKKLSSQEIKAAVATLYATSVLLKNSTLPMEEWKNIYSDGLKMGKDIVQKHGSKALDMKDSHELALKLLENEVLAAHTKDLQDGLDSSTAKRPN